MESARSFVSLKKLTAAALMAALTAVLSQIAIPMPVGVPVTLQTFAIALCGYLLGWKYGGLAVLVYLLLGAAGVPVFAQFHGGIGVLAGMTGGYLSGFLPMALLCGAGARMKNKWLAILPGVGGLAVCHLLGVLQFAGVTGNGLMASFVVASLPYLIKDVASVVVALLLTLTVRRRLQTAGLIE